VSRDDNTIKKKSTQELAEQREEEALFKKNKVVENLPAVEKKSSQLRVSPKDSQEEIKEEVPVSYAKVEEKK
jgi:hypothetical protein